MEGNPNSANIEHISIKIEPYDENYDELDNYETKTLASIFRNPSTIEVNDNNLKLESFNFDSNISKFEENKLT